MAFGTMLKALQSLIFQQPTTKHQDTQQAVLNGALVQIGQSIKLSFQNTFRHPSSNSKVMSVTLDTLPVTPAPASPKRRRKGNTAANPPSEIANVSATPRRGHRTKLRRTTPRTAPDECKVHRFAASTAQSLWLLGRLVTGPNPLRPMSTRPSFTSQG